MLNEKEEIFKANFASISLSVSFHFDMGRQLSFSVLNFWYLSGHCPHCVTLVIVALSPGAALQISVAKELRAWIIAVNESG